MASMKINSERMKISENNEMKMALEIISKMAWQYQ